MKLDHHLYLKSNWERPF